MKKLTNPFKNKNEARKFFGLSDNTLGKKCKDCIKGEGRRGIVCENWQCGCTCHPIKKDLPNNILVTWPGADIEFYADKHTQCYICGISSFSHRHKKGMSPKDYEIIPVKQRHNPMQNSPNPMHPPEIGVYNDLKKGLQPETGLEEWIEEFDKKFVEKTENGLELIADYIQGELLYASDIKEFIKNLLTQKTEEIRKEIILLIAKECNVARSENQTTSRLTSLAVKISELLK